MIEVSNLNKNEILKYLGYKGGDIDKDIERLIDECIDEVSKYSEVKYVYNIFKIDRRIQQDGEESLFLHGTDFELIGNDIKNMLSDCDSCILFAATLGVKVDKSIRMYQIKSLEKSVIMDCCASTAIENVCNQINYIFIEKYRADNLYLTDRFSPGYGDMPINVQSDFSNILDMQRRIGVSVSSSGIMIPRKSVTAIIGISKNKQTKRFAGCENCNMFRTCTYRKNNRLCNNARE